MLLTLEEWDWHSGRVLACRDENRGTRVIYRRLAWFRKYVEGRWRALSRWLQVNALAPEWLPPRWRQPLVGYLLAVTLTLLAIALEVGAVHLLPHIDAVSGVFVFLLILFVGLNWGAGPSLLATVLGTFLLVYLIYPPPFTITWKNVTDMLQAGLVLFGGLFVAQTASQRGRQRREAEQRAYEAERERRRQRAMLETLLAMVAALVQTPPAAEAEMPAEDLVFQRLAELLSYALGGQRISLWSLEPETEMLTLLGAVGHSPDQAPPWRDISGQRVPAHAWLEARLLARLQDGEAVYTELPLSPNGASPSRKTRLLVVPIQRDHTLLGLVTFDPPWTTAQAPTEDLALLQAMARLGALVIERERLLSARELAQAEALAQRESRRQMEAFLGIAGHELKTPLTSIVLALQAAQRRLDHLTHQEATEQERTTVLGYMHGAAGS